MKQNGHYTCFTNNGNNVVNTEQLPCLGTGAMTHINNSNGGEATGEVSLQARRASTRRLRTQAAAQDSGPQSPCASLSL
jgi:hypothetical protein